MNIKAVSKINKLDSRIDAHRNEIIKNIATQGSFATIRAILKEQNNKKVETNE